MLYIAAAKREQYEIIYNTVLSAYPHRYSGEGYLGTRALLRKVARPMRPVLIYVIIELSALYSSILP